MAILTNFLISLILTIPLGELGRIYIGEGIALRISDIVLLMNIATFFVVSFRKKTFFIPSYFLYTIPFLSIALLSLLLNAQNLNYSQFTISGLYLLRFSAYSLIVPIIFSLSKESKNKIKKSLIFSGSLVLVLSYLQYFFYGDLRNLYYLGWDEHLGRMFGTFLDPNYLGIFLVLFSIYLGIVILSKKRKEKFQILLLSFTLAAVILTFSRTAILTLLFAAFLFSFFFRQTKILLIGVFFIISGAILFPKFYQSEGTNLLRGSSVESRIESWDKAFNIFRENPFLGVGFNSYRYQENTSLGSARPDHSGAGVENSYLFVLATTGILGFTAYIYFLFKVFYEAKTLSKKSRENLVLVISLLCLSLSAFFINSLFYIPLLIWLFVLLGLKGKI